jgi:hypothetical protein
MEPPIIMDDALASTLPAEATLLSMETQVLPPKERVQTTLTAPAQPGDISLQVQDDSGFNIGENIIINEGFSNAEVCEVSGFGSILLRNPLMNSHDAGACVAVVSQVANFEMRPMSPVMSPMLPMSPVTVYPTAETIFAPSAPTHGSLRTTLPAIPTTLLPAPMPSSMPISSAPVITSTPTIAQTVPSLGAYRAQPLTYTSGGSISSALPKAVSLASSKAASPAGLAYEQLRGARTYPATVLNQSAASYL